MEIEEEEDNPHRNTSQDGAAEDQDPKQVLVYLCDALDDSLRKCVFTIGSKITWVSSTLSTRAPTLSTSAIPPEIDRLLCIMALEAERRELRDIVTCNNEFTREPGAEPAWNDSVHAPLLRLSVHHTTDIAVENVTRANITKSSISASNEHVELPLSGGSGDSSDTTNEGLYRRIYRFVDNLEPRTFNQTTYERLRLAPSVIFVETKLELERHPEGQTQLGMWLAAW